MLPCPAPGKLTLARRKTRPDREGASKPSDSKPECRPRSTASTLDPVSLVELLNEIGARNAIGRVDLVEKTVSWVLSHEVVTRPQVELFLVTAHRELEALCLERDVTHFKQHVALKYAELVYFRILVRSAPRSARCFSSKAHRKNVTGSVTLSL